jgi:class 3 adenylate cyclase
MDDQRDHRIKRAAMRCRMDLIQEIISFDRETGRLEARMLPDPRRHIKIDSDEPGTWYLDKYLNEAVRLEGMAQSMGGVPIFASGRTVSSASEYADERRSALEQEFDTGEYVPPRESGRPHAALSAEEERDVSFISLDICGSSAYRQRDPAGFDKAFSILLRELGSTVGQFDGSLLKITGDGFIAFIDVPSFTILADSTADLCGTMLHVLHSGVNPAIAKAGLEPLSVRIGADYGPAAVRQLAVPLTGYTSTEVSSDALNRAVKIEQSCDSNTVRIGFDLYRILHVQWMERCRKVEFDGEKVGISGYEVFQLR